MEKVNQKITHRQRQALETRRLIVEAATALFLEQGYTATTIDAIADKAGVAVSTVYSIFKNKRGILREIKVMWHAESQGPALYEEAATYADPHRYLELSAHAARRQWEIGDIQIAIYESAASSDPEAAAEFDDAQNNRRTNLGNHLRDIYPLLRQDLSAEQATAILLALTHWKLYHELVSVAGWSPDAYEAWLAGALKQQLLPNQKS